MELLYYILISIYHSIITLLSILLWGPNKLYNRLKYFIKKYWFKNPNEIPFITDSNVVLLIHGRGGCPTDFSPLYESLSKTHNNVFCVDLGNTVNTTVEEDTMELDRQIQNMTNCNITCIGHSKGGIICSNYLNKYNNNNNNIITKVITISSPVKGTALASLACGIANTDLMYKSDHLIEIEDGLLLKEYSAKIFHIVAIYDNVILPVETSYFDHVPKENVYMYKGLYNHCCLPYDKEIIDVIHAWLKN
jgi:pimeloyl-ACP methyl ester carboxylesterase